MSTAVLKLTLRILLAFGLFVFLSGCTAVFGGITAVDNARSPDYVAANQEDLSKLEAGTPVKVGLKNNLQAVGSFLRMEEPDNTQGDDQNAAQSVRQLIIRNNGEEIAINQSEIATIEIEKNKRSAATSAFAGALVDAAIIYWATTPKNLSIGPIF